MLSSSLLLPLLPYRPRRPRPRIVYRFLNNETMPDPTTPNNVLAI